MKGEGIRWQEYGSLVRLADRFAMRLSRNRARCREERGWTGESQPGITPPGVAGLGRCRSGRRRLGAALVSSDAVSAPRLDGRCPFVRRNPTRRWRRLESTASAQPALVDMPHSTLWAGRTFRISEARQLSNGRVSLAIRQPIRAESYLVGPDIVDCDGVGDGEQERDATRCRKWFSNRPGR